MDGSRPTFANSNERPNPTFGSEGGSSAQRSGSATGKATQCKNLWQYLSYGWEESLTGIFLETAKMSRRSGLLKRRRNRADAQRQIGRKRRKNDQSSYPVSIT
ncbi:hypothetical protein AVEN_131510-1 [Araneus ventricosus]|uniref:Uncharacterized protein n=1 Tax=Araneus ventricosus TaxID=182803 RepID=A0A4Y2KGR3_ARAVE|nr:hypothetical protein AVEN_131510-1 [Araneus ventricosus]